MGHGSLQTSSPPGCRPWSQQLCFLLRCVGSRWASWDPFLPPSERSQRQNCSASGRLLASLSPIPSSLPPPLHKPGSHLRGHLIRPTFSMYLGNINTGMEEQANPEVFPKQAKLEISAFPPQKNNTYCDASRQEKNRPQDALNQHKLFPQPWPAQKIERASQE